MPGREARGGLQVEHLRGQVADGLLDLLLLVAPQPAAQPGQRGPALRARPRTSAPGRSSSWARRASCRRKIPAPGALRPARPSPAASGRDSGAMPWATCTTRSPSRSSRKLSITRPSRRRGRALQLHAMEQLAAADQHDAVGHQAEAAAATAPAGNAAFPAGRAACEPKISPSRWISASVWQTMNISWPAPARPARRAPGRCRR